MQIQFHSHWLSSVAVEKKTKYLQNYFSKFTEFSRWFKGTLLSFLSFSLIPMHFKYSVCSLCFFFSFLGGVAYMSKELVIPRKYLFGSRHKKTAAC